MTQTYHKLAEYGYQTATLDSISSLVSWDQETCMPTAAGTFRAEQAAALAALIHARRTSEEFAGLIADAESDPGIEPGTALHASVREFRRDHDLAARLPLGLVEELARTTSQSQQAWKCARKDNDFGAFRPWLERVVDLTRRKAECYGVPESVGGTPAELYDALLNEYEPGARAADIQAVFDPLRDRLASLLGELGGRSHPGTDPARVRIPEDRQHRFSLFLLEALGFDLDAGRLDVAAHPFCEDMGPRDTRLTTRYHIDHFTDSLYSTLHEMGHGLYEQGLPKGEHFGTPLGQSVSLGIHESQSRLWENFVGRSLAFWTWALPHAKRILGDPLEGYAPMDLFNAVNTATPTLIRVEADEATYNMHVMIRFQLERALFSGDLDAGDLPGQWNKAYKELLGVEVPDDASGCMQDVHWSFGLFGYFPTYTLGNLYSAQIWERINEDLPSLYDAIAHGDFQPLREWLTTNIHAHARRYPAGELCQRITGRPLESGPLLRHLRARLEPVFGV